MDPAQTQPLAEPLWPVLIPGIVLVLLICALATRALPANLRVANTEQPALRWIAVIGTALVPIWIALILVTLAMALNAVATMPGFAVKGAPENRWFILGYVGLLTALGGLIAAPFAILRLFFTSRQTVAQEQGLITDRINKAVEALGAEKVVNRLGRNFNYTHEGEEVRAFEWQDDPKPVPEGCKKKGDWEPIGVTKPNLEVRIGAILALERISQDSLRDHVQIMEIITAYIRENAGGVVPEDITDEEASTGEWKKWREVNPAKPLRLDIDAAFRVLERRLERPDALAKEKEANGYRPNLERAPLAGLDLRGVKLPNSLLTNAELKGADLTFATLQGANLRGAKLQGAYLGYVVVDADTNLTSATLRGALVRFVDFTKVPQIEDHVGEMFNAGRVTLPRDGLAFGGGTDDDLSDRETFIAWRAWLEAKNWPDVPLPKIPEE